MKSKEKEIKEAATLRIKNRAIADIQKILILYYKELARLSDSEQILQMIATVGNDTYELKQQFDEFNVTIEIDMLKNQSIIDTWAHRKSNLLAA